MTAGATEEWRDIPGYEGRYQASSMGRVRSLTRRVNCGLGRTHTVRGRILAPTRSVKSNGYLCVHLGDENRGVPVHQVVASAFLGKRPDGPDFRDVRHLDGDPLNNRVTNLVYGSRKENIQDIYRTRSAWKKLTTEDVVEIRKRIAAGERHADIAHDYGIHKSSVSAIKRGRTYAWLK